MNIKSSVLIAVALLFLFMLFLSGPNAADAFYSFRCGTKLVRTGDTKLEILEKCGPPALRAEGSSGTGGGDVWIYGRGSTRSAKILRFTGAKLTVIEDSRGHGYAGP